MCVKPQTGFIERGVARGSDPRESCVLVILDPFLVFFLARAHSFNPAFNPAVYFNQYLLLNNGILHPPSPSRVLHGLSQPRRRRQPRGRHERRCARPPAASSPARDRKSRPRPRAPGPLHRAPARSGRGASALIQRKKKKEIRTVIVCIFTSALLATDNLRAMRSGAGQCQYIMTSVMTVPLDTM